MTEHRGPKNQTPRSVDLEPEEEKVIRMQRGIRAPDDLELEMRGKNHPDTWAKLREIENRAFQMSGRLDALKAEAKAAEEAAATKDKIVSKLKEKTQVESEAAEVVTASKSKKRRS